jgi:leucyl aminopeptidase (aminopeptidase T)
MNFESSIIGASHILFECGSLSPNEKVLLISDKTTSAVAAVFEQILTANFFEYRTCEIPLMTVHGQEPTEDVALQMYQANLIVCLTKFSMAHTLARKKSTDKGSRFLSLPYFDLDLLADKAILVDYSAQAPLVRLMETYFTAGKTAYVSSSAGTKLSLDIRGRFGNYCPGFVRKPGELGSPPDIEANVSPVENASEGVIVVDGSITCDEFGLLETPIIMEINKGKVVKITSENSNYVANLESILGPIGSSKRVVAELGVGFNPNAILTGRMLTDEGAAGFVHFGFGSNSTVGGKNEVAFHLDFVIKNPNLSIDQNVLIVGGEFCNMFQNL